jgi:ABC-2 type transport system permease protein
MAVYKKTYRPYEGELTPHWKRLAVMPRYAFEDLNRSRFLTIFFLASFVYPLICALVIYVRHNASVLSLLGIQGGTANFVPIGTFFFMSLLGWQSMLALFMASFIGPGLVSPDLANNALSLYLSRPFSRAEYVFGKMAVLLILLSAMTWIPGLLCFALQAYLEGGTWMADNWRYASGLFFGSWIWILILSLLALALSAWVKWKPASGALMFGVFFVAGGFGATINGVQRTNWGHMFNISYLIGSVWVDLFEGANKTTNGALFFRAPRGQELPIWCSWVGLFGLCAICLFMLNKKIRGMEVVR